MTAIQTDEWDVEHEVSVELDNGEVVRATGVTIVEALRNLADAIGPSADPTMVAQYDDLIAALAERGVNSREGFLRLLDVDG